MKLISGLILLSFIFLSCAQMLSPDGGPVDKTAPQIIKSEPLNYSTNFEGNSIKITFDEYVTVNSLKQEYLLSPPLENDLKFKLKKRSLFISFTDTLHPKTTYSLNFGEGVKDFHEANNLDSNTFIFSTGNYVDSNRIKGKIKDAFDLSDIEKVHVMLYNSLSDSTPAKSKPFYYTKSKKDGGFELSHLKEGEYQLFVLEDKNANLLYDLPNERIGFVDKSILAEHADSMYVVHLFEEKYDNQYLEKSLEEHYGKVLLVFHQELKNLQINILDSNINKPWYKWDFSEQNDSLILWHNLAKYNEMSLRVELIDDSTILDTITLKLTKFPEHEELNKLRPIIRSNFSSVADYFEPLKIKLSSPIVDFNSRSAWLINRADTSTVELIQINDREFKLDYSLEEDQLYKVVIPDSTFFDYLNLTNDSFVVDFKTKSSIEYASLKLRIKGLEAMPHFLELKTADDKLVERVSFKNQSEFTFINMNPGKYKIKLTFDENGNDQWDPGTFIPRKLPEKVIYFSGEIDIKEGWDKELEWILN